MYSKHIHTKNFVPTKFNWNEQLSPKVRHICVVLVRGEALEGLVRDVVPVAAHAGVLPPAADSAVQPATALVRVRHQTEGGLPVAGMSPTEDGFQRVVALVHVGRDERRRHDPGKGEEDEKAKGVRLGEIS